MFQPKYAILHKPTGSYMPVPTGYKGRGSSNWEPTEKAGNQDPRLFNTLIAAKRALSSWLMGMHKPVIGYEDFWDRRDCPVQEGIEIVRVPSRKREEMSIVELQFTIKSVVV